MYDVSSSYICSPADPFGTYVSWDSKNGFPLKESPVISCDQLCIPPNGMPTPQATVLDCSMKRKWMLSEQELWVVS